MQAYLLDVKDAKVNIGALLGIVELRAFDDDSMRWQVDTPSQSGCAHQDLSAG